MTAAADVASLRDQHARQIRENAERIAEFAGYVITRVNSGHADSVGMYAADIVAAGQRIMTGHAAIEAIDVLATAGTTTGGNEMTSVQRGSGIPFVRAEILPGRATGTTVRYACGHGTSGTGEHEVIQVIAHPDGRRSPYVIMRGASEGKTRAAAMILNAPEEEW